MRSAMLRSYLTRTLLVLAGIALIASGWWLYDLGRLHGADELRSLRTRHEVLEKRYGKVLGDNRDLREKVAILQRSSQIDRQAALGVKADLATLEEELQAAREEVEFYRGIVSPGDVKPGLRIHRFQLVAGAVPGEYRYDLVLTQLKHNDHPVSGVAEWRIAGSTNGEPGDLGLADVTRPPVMQLKFKFRYFQDLAGTLHLPDGFEAKKVVLSIRPEGKGNPQPVEQEYDWPDQGS
ncbi:MAG: hypothetical protein PVG72_09940 [Gammaproteobacteria bacterium]|jgi:hypothetical protein